MIYTLAAAQSKKEWITHLKCLRIIVNMTCAPQTRDDRRSLNCQFKLHCDGLQVDRTHTAILSLAMSSAVFNYSLYTIPAAWVLA